jgi:hypothetical protein
LDNRVRQTAVDRYTLCDEGTRAGSVPLHLHGAIGSIADNRRYSATSTVTTYLPWVVAPYLATPVAAFRIAKLPAPVPKGVVADAPDTRATL